MIIPFLLLRNIMNASIHFNHKLCLVTVKISNKTINNLLPSEFQTQHLLPSYQLPQLFFRSCHHLSQVPGLLKLVLLDPLQIYNSTT